MPEPVEARFYTLDFDRGCRFPSISDATGGWAAGLHGSATFWGLARRQRCHLREFAAINPTSSVRGSKYFPRARGTGQRSLLGLKTLTLILAPPQNLCLQCAAHKCESHHNLVDRKCTAAEGCFKLPIFGDKNDGIPLFCAAHKMPGGSSLAPSPTPPLSLTHALVFVPGKYAARAHVKRGLCQNSNFCLACCARIAGRRGSPSQHRPARGRTRFGRLETQTPHARHSHPSPPLINPCSAPEPLPEHQTLNPPAHAAHPA